MRDSRKFARQTQNRLVVGLLALLFTVGLILIYFLYSPGQHGSVYLAGILIPLLIILLILNVIERLATIARE